MLDEKSLTLTVARITFTAPNGTSIFTGQNNDGEGVRVVAYHDTLPHSPRVGDLLKIVGIFFEHRQYGMQFYVSRGTYTIPKGRLIVSYLANHSDFVGIGPNTAKSLYDAFGDRLVSLLNQGHVGELSGVLPLKKAERLVFAWAEKREETGVVAFLDEHGFDVRLANRLRRVWGGQVIDMLTLNPYFMLAFASWSKTDAAAMSLGVELNDPRRLIGAVENALYERLQSGHTLTQKNQLNELLRIRIDDKWIEHSIELAVADLAICGDAMRGYQPIGVASLESRITERIRAILIDAKSLKNVSNQAWLDNAIFQSERSLRFTLNMEQREAVKMALTRPFSLITGGAGVGKTTVLHVIVEIAERHGLTIIQMALAGRAAKKMAEASGLDAMTIAKFLHQVKLGKINVPRDSLVIIDEASMLDLPTTFRILKHLPDGIQLLFLGDPAQLPPIGFGLVFPCLCSSLLVPQVALTAVHRQTAETGIPTVAADVRVHQLPNLLPYTGKFTGVSFIDCLPEHIPDQLSKLAIEWGTEEWQILCAIKQGAAGMHAINKHFGNLNIGEKLVGFNFSVGEPVIHLINDYERGLMNGTLGTIVAVTNANEPGLLIDFEGTEHFISSFEITERLELAYAISVHKAQGSQFNRVAIALTKSRILDHSLIYTALTRGIKQVVFVGERTAFESAILNPSLAHKRQVGFSV
jgi:exodeoxyribonuclease V alpha subunit